MFQQKSRKHKAFRLPTADSKQYVDSIPGLIDKYLQYVNSGNEIPSVIVLLVTGWIFIQDNQAGRLQDWKSLLWTVQKCSFFWALYFAYRLAAWITKRLLRQGDNTGHVTP
jgi:hypothetical protein